MFGRRSRTVAAPRRVRSFTEIALARSRRGRCRRRGRPAGRGASSEGVLGPGVRLPCGYSPDRTRRRRGCDVDIPWERSRGDAAATTRTFRGDRGAPQVRERDAGRRHLHGKCVDRTPAAPKKTGRPGHHGSGPRLSSRRQGPERPFIFIRVRAVLQARERVKRRVDTCSNETRRRQWPEGRVAAPPRPPRGSVRGAGPRGGSRRRRGCDVDRSLEQKRRRRVAPRGGADAGIPRT